MHTRFPTGDNNLDLAGRNLLLSSILLPSPTTVLPVDPRVQHLENHMKESASPMVKILAKLDQLDDKLEEVYTTVSNLQQQMEAIQ